MKGFLRFVAGFLVGMTLSAVVVTLLAPSSGSETQRRLRSRLQQALEEARQAAEQTRAEAYSRLAELKVQPTTAPDRPRR